MSRAGAAAWGAVVATLLVVVAILRRSVRRVEVVGSSMEPALLATDRLMVVGVPLVRARRPRPGQVVVLRDPRRPGRTLVKRVRTVDWDRGTLEVEGDAAGASTDSRTFGPVPVTSVVGRAVYRYAPPHRRGPLARQGEYHRG